MIVLVHDNAFTKKGTLWTWSYSGGTLRQFDASSALWGNISNRTLREPVFNLPCEGSTGQTPHETSFAESDMVKRSFGPGLVLAGVSAFAVGAILYVHYDQKWQKEVSVSWSSPG